MDNAKKKVKEFANEVLDGDNPAARALYSAKVDTLEATCKAAYQGNRRRQISNQKFAQLEYIHLRLARELRHYDASGADYKRFVECTGAWCGGNGTDGSKGVKPVTVVKNCVSAYFTYSEPFDYEYVDRVFPFNESIQLPTATSKSDGIADKLLQ